MTIVLLLPSSRVAVAQASSALNSGLSAAATGRGGTLATAQGDPLDAIEGNTAGLASLAHRTAELGAVGAFTFGSFQNSVDAHGHIDHLAGALPFGAVGLPIGTTPWKVALGFTPDMLMRATWTYTDPPGTAGASYGLQKNQSQIVALRGSATVARSFGPHWTAGATLGLVYNANTLVSPYIFQQQPQLAGLKVLLDLHTHGVGWNGGAGAQWQPTSTLRIGASWKSGTSIASRGEASGTASAQFAALGVPTDPTYHYQAEVDNRLPQSAAAGLTWQARPNLRLAFEGGWTGWASAFRQLPVVLTQGTNATINGIVGSDTLIDGVPLHWRNQGQLHAGIERPFSEQWIWRAGYGFQSNPVPAKTLTPLTADILQHSLATGSGWSHSHWRVDAAYQVHLPATQSVAQSSLLAGEYDNSRVHVWIQTITLTVCTNF